MSTPNALPELRACRGRTARTSRPRTTRTARASRTTTAIGWDGNYWPVFEYLSGSFFARGVDNTYNSGGTTFCGAMYSFSAYDYGGDPGAQSVQWTEDNGYLPAMKTTRTSGSVGISIKDFADKVTIGGNAFVLVYTRVSVTNNGSVGGDRAARRLRPEPAPADQLIAWTPWPPGQTNNHDFVVAVDNFGTGAALPTGARCPASAPELRHRLQPDDVLLERPAGRDEHASRCRT